MTWCRAGADGVWLTVLAVPNGKSNQVLGVSGDALRIRLRAQPVEGKANDALVAYLAELLELPRGAIKIKRGLTARRKTLELGPAALNADEVARRLLDAAID